MPRADLIIRASVLSLVLASALLAQEQVLSVPNLTAHAQIIGVATVQSQNVRLNPQNNMIYTDYLLHFTDVWNGTPDDPFILMKVGGQLGDRVVQVAGRDYQLKAGESIVVFAAPSIGGSHVIVGVQQGLYQVHDGTPRTVSRWMATRPPGGSAQIQTLASLKDEVFRTLGRSPTGTPGTSNPPGETSKRTGIPESMPPGEAAQPPPARPPDGAQGGVTTSDRPEMFRIVVVGLLVLGVLAFTLRRFRTQPRS
jgi:hypothetical protein